MPDLVPVLLGVAGLVDGEVHALALDTPVVVGRSRSCPISLRRSPRYLAAPAATRDADHDLNTVSRQHLRITITGGVAEVEDLSSNGTLMDGTRLEGRRRVDLGAAPCLLRLGTREQFELRLLERGDSRLGPSTTPLPAPA